MSKQAEKAPKNRVARVPVIMQMEALECGAACLDMVLAYYGKWVPLARVRKDCGVSRDGSKAKNVARAARQYGLSVEAFRTETEALREYGSFPCIIHWNFNHFVVLKGFRRNRAYINDPARGEVQIPIEDFEKSFTGIVLMFEPSEDFVPGGKRKSMLEFFASRLKGASAAVWLMVLSGLITSLIQMLEPGFSRIFIDYILSGKNSDWFYPFIGCFSLLCLVELFVMWIQVFYTMRLGGKMDAYGSSSFLWKVLRMPMDFFSQRMAGDIKMRMASNAQISRSVVDTLTPIAFNVIMMFFYLIVMARYSIFLTVLGILTSVVNILVSGAIARKHVNITRRQMRDEGRLASTTLSGIRMIETIKSSGAENGFFERWSGIQASVNASRVSADRTDAHLGLIASSMESVTDILILAGGVYLTINGQFTPGMIMTFRGFMGSFLNPVKSLISARRVIQEMRTDMERLDDVMEYEEDKNIRDRELREDVEYKKLSGAVEIRNVSFGYSPLAPPIVRDFSASIPAGGSVAFVGASGCGKSTLANLISNLYTPWEGEIRFDGLRADEIDRGVFYGSLAVVDQDIIIFEDTIANNIRMWDDTIEDFEVILAARDAGIHKDIMMREGGYQYHLTEGGEDFSGGQRQRLEIARVLASDPTIVIMDEATSALDAKTENEVVRAIRDRGITTIVIAHRLSTIRDCDEIIVLDDGEVVERGTHDELMKLGGRYMELVTNE